MCEMLFPPGFSSCAVVENGLYAEKLGYQNEKWLQILRKYPREKEAANKPTIERTFFFTASKPVLSSL